MTAKVDVTDIVSYSRKAGTKSVYSLKSHESREDYRRGYLYQSDELIGYDVVDPTQYVLYENTDN